MFLRADLDASALSFGHEPSEVSAMLRNHKGKAVKLKVVAAHTEADPDYKKLYDQEQALIQKLGGKIDWVKMSAPIAAGHLWKAELPKDLPAGIYSIEVQAQQPNGAVYKGLRPIRVAN